MLYIKDMENKHNGWGGARKGAGRKKTGINYANITLSMTKQQAELLRNYAKSMNLTVSQFVLKLTRLDELTPKKKSEEKNDRRRN